MPPIEKPYSSREDLRQPILDAIRELGGKARPPQVEQAVARFFNASEDFIEARHDNGDKIFYKELAWTVHNLQREGLLAEDLGHGVWGLPQMPMQPLIITTPNADFLNQNEGDDLYSAESQNENEQDEICDIYSNADKARIAEALKNTINQTDEHVIVNTKRYKRDNKAIALIKLYRDMKCQMCKSSIMKKNKKLYIEAAHITPKRERGKETPDNILVLCPNHHKEFDLGELNIHFRDIDKIHFTLNNETYTIELSV